jgi:mannose-6-phosphate isomerase-like protein (cupin superfamily)
LIVAEAEWLFSLVDVEASLPGKAAKMNFSYALRHGSMKFGLYAPLGVDNQEPHLQDELYIVVSGAGALIKNGERRALQQNDVIFVEAGATHRFVDFTSDFKTCVIFWGPEVGEA